MIRIFAACGSLALLLLLSCLAQAQQRGGSFSGGNSFGGGLGGGGLAGGFGGGFSGSSTSSGRLLGISNGFRPNSTDPFAATRGSFGQQGSQQFGGGQFGQFGNQSGFNQMGGNNRNNFMNQGGNQSAGSRLPTGALSETLKPLPPANLEVKVRLEQLLSVSSGVKDGRDIIIAIDGEVLVLRGFVRNEGEKRMAESMLHLEPGVREVRNELEVKPPPSRP